MFTEKTLAIPGCNGWDKKQVKITKSGSIIFDFYNSKNNAIGFKPNNKETVDAIIDLFVSYAIELEMQEAKIYTQEEGK